MALLEPLLEAGVPLVVYVEKEWMSRLQARAPKELVRLRETCAEQRWTAFGAGSDLEAAWRSAARPQRLSLDYFVVTLTKMGMLHDQSIWDPFGTRHLAWVDADVAASVHPLYLTRERLLEALPCLLERFLLLARPSPCTDAAGLPAASRVQTQLFGGEAGAIAEINALYYQQLEEELRRGQLPSDESLLTRLLERHPERFDRFLLQENGLLGALFEEMRTGHVPIERTLVH